MAISHVKTNGVADFTGTVTVFNSQGSTTTAAATDLLRPSDWNSVHNQYSTLSGNTVNSSALSGTNIVLQGGNNITLSGTTAAGAATVVISGPNTVAQSVQPVAVSGSNGSFAFSTVTFGNSNGLLFYTTNGSVVGSYTVPTQTVESQSLGISNLGNTAGTSGIASGGQVRVLFAGGNNVTLSQSLNGASATITISAANSAAQTVESQTLGISNLGNSAGTSGVASGGQVRMLFAGGNNITLSQSLNGASGTITISGPNTVAQTNQSLGLYASSQTFGQSSSSTVDARSLSIVGSGGASVGMSAGSLLIYAPAAGGATGALSVGMSNLGNTAGTSGTVSSQLVFAGGNNITLSQSVNGQSATLSIVGGGGGAGATLSALRPIDIGGYEWITGQYGQNQPFFFPQQVPVNLSLNVLQFPLLFSGATNSTGTLGISLDIGFYTWNNSSSFSLLTSMRVDTTITHSGTQNSVSNVGGIRVLRQSVAGFSLPPGDYIVGFRSSTSSAGANASFSHWVASNINTAQSGIFGANTNATYQMEPGLGYHSATSSVLPNGVGLSQLSGTNTYLLRPVLWTLYRTT